MTDPMFSAHWWRVPSGLFIGVTINSDLLNSFWLVEPNNRLPPKGHPILEFIRQDIAESGLPAKIIAQRAGVRPDTLYAWCRRKVSRPHVKTVKRVLHALGWANLPPLEQQEKRPRGRPRTTSILTSGRTTT